MIENRLPASQRSPESILLIWLTLLTMYRIWVVQHLDITLFVDEAQYWTWAKQLDWGYYSKPPVIAWIIAASTALFGDSMVAVKLPALLLYPASSWVVFLLGRDLYGSRTALLCAITFSLLPFVAAAGMFVATDAPLLFLWTLALLALRRAVTGNLWRDWILLGVAVGLGVMAKYTMLAFGASALLWLLLAPERRRQLGNPRLWTALLIAAVLILPNILWNWSHDFPTLRHTADITHVEINDKHGNAREFILAQIVSMGPLLALAFAAALVASLRRWRDPDRQLLLCFCVPLFSIVVFQAWRSEANGNWAAPAFVAAMLLAVEWLSAYKLRWWAIAVLCNGMLMLGAYHMPDYYALKGVPIPDRIDYFKRARAWDKLAALVRPMLREHPDAVLFTDNRTLSAHLLYELRDLHPQLLTWKPKAHPEDHYQLTRPLTMGDAERTLVFVTQDNPASVMEHFEKHEKLAHISVRSGDKLRREADVILLKGFKGY